MVRVGAEAGGAGGGGRRDLGKQPEVLAALAPLPCCTGRRRRRERPCHAEQVVYKHVAVRQRTDEHVLCECLPHAAAVA